MEIGSPIDQEETTRKRLAWSPQPILRSNRVDIVQAQREDMEKGALQRENKGKGQRNRVKEKILPNAHTVS